MLRNGTMLAILACALSFSGCASTMQAAKETAIAAAKEALAEVTPVLKQAGADLMTEARAQASLLASDLGKQALAAWASSKGDLKATLQTVIAQIPEMAGKAGKDVAIEALAKRIESMEGKPKADEFRQRAADDGIPAALAWGGGGSGAVGIGLYLLRLLKQRNALAGAIAASPPEVRDQIVAAADVHPAVAKAARAAVVVLGLALFLPAQSISVDSTTVTLAEGTRDVGLLRIRIYAMGPIFAAELENRGRVVWDNGGDWVAFKRWAVTMPATMRPTWNPYDGTILEAPDADVASPDRTWVVLGPQHAPARHGWSGARQPQGHGLEGRQILRVVFGPPGVELAPSAAGMAIVDRYVGGGIAAIGVPGIESACRGWGLGPDPLHSVRPRAAGYWWLSADQIYPYAWRPFRGVRLLGATPGADGEGRDPQTGKFWGAGENARYSSPTWMLASGAPGSLLLALQVARSVAASGVVHEGLSDAYPAGWMTGMRRYESSEGDFVGDSGWPKRSHNWSDDVQLAAAVFPDDPLLARTAAEMRAELLRYVDLFPRAYQTRDVDRWLSGLRAAFMVTGDAKYSAHAKRVIEALFATMKPGEAWFPDTYGPTSFGISPWMDAGTLWRVIEWADFPGIVTPEILARVESVIRFYMSLNTVDPANGATITRYHMENRAGTWSVSAQDAPWVTQSYYPQLAPWWVGPLWWMGDRDPSMRPVARAVVAPWAAAHKFPEEWVEGNVSAKTRGQAMLACLRNGAMLGEVLGW